MDNGRAREAGSDKLLDSVSAADILDAAPDAILIVDSSGIIVTGNTALTELFGFDKGALIGRPVESLLPTAMRQAHVQRRQNYTADPQPRSMGAGMNLLAQRRDGSTVPVDIALSPIQIADQNYVFAAVRDISESVSANQELQRTQQEAALLEDRERVARDLHDTVIQRVFAVGLGLQSLAGRTEDAAVGARIAQAIDDLDGVIHDIRTAIFGLVSHKDWGRGLRGEALRVAAHEGRALGFEPALSFSGSIDEIDAELADQLLPTLREALSNVARHAEARHCQVTITVHDERLALVVTDDGVGPSGANDGTGHGLANLASRAKSLGGTCELLAGTETGSRLEWHVPLVQQ